MPDHSHREAATALMSSSATATLSGGAGGPQAAQDLPLIFQRARIGDVDFQSEEADRHECPIETRGDKSNRYKFQLRRPRRFPDASIRRTHNRSSGDDFSILEGTPDFAYFYVVEFDIPRRTKIRAHFVRIVLEPSAAGR